MNSPELQGMFHNHIFLWEVPVCVCRSVPGCWTPFHPAPCSHWAQHVSDTWPQTVLCMDQRGPKYCRREQQQLSPVSNTKPLHPSKREEICVIQCKMCFCSSEMFPVLKCNCFFFTQYTCLVLKEIVSVPNPAGSLILVGSPFKPLSSDHNSFCPLGSWFPEVPRPRFAFKSSPSPPLWRRFSAL